MGFFSIFSSNKGSEDVVTPVVVDLCSLSGSGPNDQNGGGPKAKAFALRRLSVFAEREEIPVTAVIQGSPLREAGDGDEYGGVTVRYLPQGKDLTDFIFGIARKAGAGAVVVTSDSKVLSGMKDKRMAVMSVVTFRKAVDSDEGRRPMPRRRPPVGAPDGAPERQAESNDLIDTL